MFTLFSIAEVHSETPGARESSTLLSPQALQEIALVEAEIDRIEAQTIERLAMPPDNQVQQIELLGKVMLYDKELSVKRNEACAFCHMPEMGFTGPVSELTTRHLRARACTVRARPGSALRRIGVVTVAVPRADSAVPSVDEELRMLVAGNLAAAVNRFALGSVDPEARCPPSGCRGRMVRFGLRPVRFGFCVVRFARSRD